MHHPKSKAYFRNEIVKGYGYKEKSVTQAINILRAHLWPTLKLFDDTPDGY